ncbi:MAG: YbbR-like domain-containing protein [bacterium]
MNSRRFFAHIVRNWPAKVISIAAAVVLVVFYNISRLDDRFFTVPLEVSVDDEFIAASAVPTDVRLRLRGEPEVIDGIREDDVRAVVDFTDHDSPGTYAEPVRIRKIGSALDAAPVEIRVEPAQVEMELAVRATKSVDVEPTIQGFAPTGYHLSQYQVSPSTVEIEGPEEVVNGIELVRTEEIELSGREEDFTVRVRLRQPEPLIEFPGGSIVEFRGIIEETVVLRTIEPVEIVLLDLDPDLRLISELPGGLVRVQARQVELEEVSPSQVQIVADASEVDGPGTYTLDARPSVPRGLVVLRYEPTTVEVEVASTNAQ